MKQILEIFVHAYSVNFVSFSACLITVENLHRFFSSVKSLALASPRKLEYLGGWNLQPLEIRTGVKHNESNLPSQY